MDDQDDNLSSKSPNKTAMKEFMLNIQMSRFYRAHYTPLSAAKSKSSSTDSLQVSQASSVKAKGCYWIF